MSVVGKNSAFQTIDGWDSWDSLPSGRVNRPGITFKPSGLGCYVWDYVTTILCASAIGNPVYKFELRFNTVETDRIGFGSK